MKQSAQQSTAVKSILLRSLLGIAFAAVLALAPAPAFAQHGGGGGGGAHGGGGGGGSHGSSGGGHPSGGSGSHPSSNASSSASSASNAGHWWNPFHGSGAPGKAGGTGSGTNAANANANNHFAAGNNTWQDPPVNTHTNPQSHFYASSNHDAAIAASRTLPRANNERFASNISREGLRRRPIIFFPFSPFGFGFGFGSPFGFGFGFGCDPLWGWNCPLGYGFGYGGGLGYSGDFGYYGGTTGYGNGYSADGSDMNLQANGTEPSAGGEDMASPEGNSGDWQSAPDNSSQGSVAAPQPYVVVFLRDGSSYAVSDYWLAGGKLHYVTSYGGENSVDANQLDLQRTVNENAAHGVTFTLRPAPATDAPGVPQSLQPPPSNDGQTPAPKPQ